MEASEEGRYGVDDLGVGVVEGEAVVVLALNPEPSPTDEGALLAVHGAQAVEDAAQARIGQIGDVVDVARDYREIDVLRRRLMDRRIRWGGGAEASGAFGVVQTPAGDGGGRRRLAHQGLWG